MDAIKKILAATDFSPSAADAVDEAVGLAAALGASVTLFHVYHLPFVPDAEVAYGPDVIEGLASAALATLAQTREDLQKRVARCPPIDIRVALGVTHEEIIAEARRGGFDLIVIGTHGRTGVRHLLLGSVAEHVVRLSPIAVLSVRAHGRPDVAAAPQ